MLDLIKQELDSQGVFTQPIHPLIKAIAQANANDNIPIRMKYLIATSEAVLYASQFHKNIAHWNGSSIPINAISFCIAESGVGKDSAVSAARKCFSPGYEQIQHQRTLVAKEKAIQAATEDSVKDPHKFQNYKDYLTPCNPIFAAISTTEGLIQHFNDLSNDGVGAGFLFTGEIGSELTTSSSIVENIRLIAEMYDEGNKEVKLLKNRDNQSKEIKNFPVSALFMGSQLNLLYDESIKKRFRTELSTKLARRAFFNYNKEKPKRKHFSTLKEAIAYEIALEDEAIKVRQEIQLFIAELTPNLLSTAGFEINISDEVRQTFVLYKKYNEYKAETIPRQFEISKIVRLHLQWKALKLAGAFAILDNTDTIDLEQYTQAISFCELLDEDMVAFEQELVKEPYELFVDYMKDISENNSSFISLHLLRKMGYIPMTGNTTQKVKDLIHLASSYDTTGVYQELNNGISYEKLEITDTIGISFKEVDTTPIKAITTVKPINTKALKSAKVALASTVIDGYTHINSTFKDLADMLAEDYAYTPFQFLEGQKGRDRIISGCKWLCLDIDDSDITDMEAHLLLSDINHHITRTSDQSNEFKFRVIIELDSVVNISDIQWSAFIQSVSKELVLNCDVLPKSQIYFSYSSNTVLSVTDAKPLEAKPHILASVEKTVPKPKPSKSAAKALLDDPIETFHYAFNASEGSRSRSLIRAAYHARDLGATKEYILNLMAEINDYLDYPLPEDRFQRTILNQIERWPIP